MSSEIGTSEVILLADAPANGTVQSYVERMRALTKSVTARNARIHARSKGTQDAGSPSAAKQSPRR